MSSIKFAEEFTKLILRWTSSSPSILKDGDGATIPLTNQQVITAMQEVLRLILNINLQVLDSCSVRTPVVGIAVCTPNAPTVSKMNVELSNGPLNRFRSLDTLTTKMPHSEKLQFPCIVSSSKSQEEMDIVENAALPEDKKFMSRSSPAIHVNSVNRSDTFVRENFDNGTKAGEKNSQEDNDVFETTVMDPLGNTINMKASDFIQKLETLQQSAHEIVSYVEDVKKELQPQTMKRISCLSSIGTGRGLTRSSTMRSIPPSKLRRASTGFPGTPTSSKLSTTITTDKNEMSSRRKTISANSMNLKSSKLKVSPSNRSSCSLTNDRKSPLPSARPPKNPKYAHVQSTIPKVQAGKKKVA